MDNTEKLVEIGSHEPFTFEVDSMTIQAFGDRVTFAVGDDGPTVEIADPAKAREIAGLLVAWSKKHDGVEFNAADLLIAMRFEKWAHRRDTDSPVNQSRQKWYYRMAPMMTTDALKRNYRDLRILAKDLANRQADGENVWSDLSDVRRSIDICYNEFDRREYTLCWKCNEFFRHFTIHDHKLNCSGHSSV